MSKRTIVGGTKDSTGAYTKPVPPTPNQPAAASPIELESIDGLLSKGLYQLQCLLRNLSMQISSGSTDRDIALGLKDVILLLMELRAHEKELLEGTPDDELEKLAK